jgi:hypothetical protein
MVKRGAGSKPLGRSNRQARSPANTTKRAPRSERQSTGKPEQTSARAKTAAQKPATRRASPRPPTANAPQAVPARPPASPGGFRAKIRMYRHGLGDCFLITLARKASPDPYRILIDCGVILGTANASDTMTKVVEDILRESNGMIDLLILTHQHWDHLSGFVQAEASFAKLKIGDVWVAWTENPADDLANKLRGERKQALASLRLGVGAMRMAGDADAANEVEGLLGFFGAAGGASTEDALAKAIGLAKGKVRYCLPADPPVSIDDTDARLFILGPPHDEKLIRQTLPSTKDPETYGVAATALGATVMAALSADDNSAPFDDFRSIPSATAEGMDFFRRWYFGPGGDAPAWRRIDAAWLDGASELALALDSATNNTSLVMAIELAGADVLLFAADAQVGNWLSWQDLKWSFDNRNVTGPDLLARAIFYKVGHHGSHNATLRDKGLELMTQLSIAAIPVYHDMAVKKHWGNMPLPALVDRLKSVAKIGVFRSDETPAQLPANVIADPLYFDIMF